MDEGHPDKETFQATLEDHIKRIRGTSRQRVTEETARRQRFEKRTGVLYQQQFALFDTIFLELQSVGYAVIKEQLPDANKDQDYLYAVLYRLWGRAVLASSEIRALLVSGHATGASARWRTIYEILVVTSFITKHGATIAERYYHHDRILALKVAEAVQKYATDPIAPTTEPAALLHLRGLRDTLAAKYGPEFITDYGWASPAIISPKKGQPNPNPTFRDIEKAVAEEGSLKLLKPWYTYTSQVIHASSFGNTHSTQNPFQDQRVVTGPSQAGFGDPAWLTLRVLLSITMYFAQVRTKGLT
ncbi:MAG: DUF5677 domain-containing protein, partial [Chloroflexota bacterium]|nr:DUF5677 domain-containing protein [Chloroflexota bacterium]